MGHFFEMIHLELEYQRNSKMDPKYTTLIDRLRELEAQLSQPDIASVQKEFRALTQEHARLTDLKALYDDVYSFTKQLEDNQELLKGERDPEFIQVLQEDISALKIKLEKADKDLKMALYPPSPYDSANTIVELRAGTGGDEAGLFVADCVRMYL